MKVALCLYGKYSGVNPRNETQSFKLGVDSLYSNVITDIVDVYIHGWNDDFADTQELLKALKPASMMLERQIGFDEDLILEEYSENPEWSTRLSEMRNRSRFYSLYRAVELVQPGYDLIMVSRYDTVYFERYDFDLLNSAGLYTSHWNQLALGCGFNDGWFTGSYALMKEFSKIYFDLDRYWAKNSDYRRYLRGYGLSEGSLVSAHHLWRYKAHEMHIDDCIWAYGLEYVTWGLARRFDQRRNPWGYPANCDIRRPVRLYSRLLY